MRNVTLFLQVETGPAQLSYSYLNCPQRKNNKMTFRRFIMIPWKSSKCNCTLNINPLSPPEKLVLFRLSCLFVMVSARQSGTPYGNVSVLWREAHKTAASWDVLCMESTCWRKLVFPALYNQALAVLLPWPFLNFLHSVFVMAGWLFVLVGRIRGYRDVFIKDNT